MRDNNHIKQGYIPIISITVFAFLSLLPAFLNGYPFVTSDTGSYIRHAFDFQIPADRSPFYGIFTGISSLWHSLWFTIVVQSFMLSYIFYKYFQLLAKNQSLYPFLVAAVFVNLCTAIGWVSGYVMPDVFTPILLLTIILYLLDRKRSHLQAAIYMSFIILAVIVHNSHYIIFLSFSCALLVLSFLSAAIKTLRKYICHLVITGVISIVCICSLHYVKGFGLTISPGSHVFMMGRMIETGVLQQYLDEHCAENKFKLCEYRSTLPENTNDFLWASSSPLYQTGGWDSSKTEYSLILKGILSTPRYQKQLFTQTAASTFKQLVDVQIDPGILPLAEGSSPWLYINTHFPADFASYANSIQTTKGFSTTCWRVAHMLFFILSCCLALWVVIKRGNREARLILLLILLFFCCNALVSAGLSNVLNRYQNRIFWILPATNFVIFLNYWSKSRRRSTSGFTTPPS